MSILQELEGERMQKRRSQTLLLLALAVLTVVFALGYFAGRQSAGTAITVRTQREEKTAPDDATAQKAQEPSLEEGAAEPAYPLDLNRATLEELMTLPRIGETLAQRIVDYRAAYGSFSAPEQLMDVEGIGEATFEGLKDLVTVEDLK